jgi:hypothetical protein
MDVFLGLEDHFIFDTDARWEGPKQPRASVVESKWIGSDDGEPGQALPSGKSCYSRKKIQALKGMLL